MDQRVHRTQDLEHKRDHGVLQPRFAGGMLDVICHLGVVQMLLDDADALSTTPTPPSTTPTSALDDGETLTRRRRE